MISSKNVTNHEFRKKLLIRKMTQASNQKLKLKES